MVDAASGVIFSVGQLNRAVGRLLASEFPQVWVRGEISNFTQAASGHWYFSIKDEAAAVRAVMFRNRARLVGLTPRPGEQFEFRATVTLYEPRGDYQLQVDAMRRAGLGNLHEQFLRLKEQLTAEGLFDSGRKREPVAMPRAVGIVTSLAAAALRDVLTTLRRRAPHVRVVIYPSPVQGAEAASGLLAALEAAGTRGEVDTILLVRGGGSLEDLWCFNDERVVRAVAASPLPVISGVGHETDVTLADFAADVRAATPTAAAELCCRSRSRCLAQLQALARNLHALQTRHLQMASLRLDRAAAMLVSPGQRLAQRRQSLASLQQRLLRLMRQPAQGRGRLEVLAGRLRQASPDLQDRRLQVQRLSGDLQRLLEHRLQQQRARLSTLAQMLEALNPEGVLERGYALVWDAEGRVVRSMGQVRPGQALELQFSDGRVRAQAGGRESDTR